MEPQRVSLRISRRRASCKSAAATTRTPRRASTGKTTPANAPVIVIEPRLSHVLEVPALQHLDFSDPCVRRRMLVAFCLGLVYPAERRTIEILAPSIRWRTMQEHMEALWSWRRIHRIRTPPLGTVLDGMDVGEFVRSARNVGVGVV